MHDHLRMSQAKMLGFGWTERVAGGLLLVLTLLLVLVVGLMILGMLVAGGVVLAGWLWWWRKRLLRSNMKHSLVIEGECRVPHSRHAAASGDQRTVSGGGTPSTTSSSITADRAC